VYANDFRHPVLLAKEAATLDQLSEGRFELGIGAGYLAGDYLPTHMPLDPPGVRVSRLAESVHLIKRLLAGEKVTFAGTYYALTEYANYPMPVQTPHPPLYLAGGSQRVLSLAGREADIVGVMVSSRDGKLDFTTDSPVATAQRIQWVREAAGERFDRLELNTIVFNVTITDDRQQAAEAVARQWGVTPEHILNSIHFLIGTVDEMCDDVQRWREQYGISYIGTVQENIDTLAPVVARLAGC
jgi:probable F420-dependent oxidoreductase